MFKRSLTSNLKSWSELKNRKPLVIRGARQTGKTTLVNDFASGFEQYIYLNLEKPEDRKFFELELSFQEMIATLFFTKGKILKRKKTLIFIDEIQNSSKAVNLLRYFYEEAPDLYVIAAGSLVESLMDKSISFPVGRIEFMVIRPVSFYEFLAAMNEVQSLELIQQIPFPEFGHEKVLKLFNLYSLLGGMPGILNEYIDTRDLTLVSRIYSSLIISYMDDVEKYGKNPSMTSIIRFIIQNAFLYAGSRIKFQGFGKSSYRSREMGEAFRSLEQSMFLQLIYPSTSVKRPALPDNKKSPRLQLLDTGLVNFFAGMQESLIEAKEIDEVFEGKIAEHLTGQELLSLQTTPLYRLNFWTREEAYAQAEVDFVWNFRNYLIPIEVKSGPTGKMRSLHQFIDRSSHPFAVRIYSGKLKIEETKTIAGKQFKLLSLPFYLIGKINNYLEYFFE
jgi:predicted AAA+ superfamily ATPase